MAVNTSDDSQAYYASVPYGLQKDSIRMLRGGTRFDREANKVYRIPTAQYDEANLTDYVHMFLEHHYNHQVARISTLQRYYEGDNDIHYWKSDKSKNRADNRIASGHPRYITTMRVGYSLGKGIQYLYNSPTDKPGVDNEQADVLMQQINEFNQEVDEEYIEKTLKKSLSVTGRAFELLYTTTSMKADGKQNVNVELTVLDPANAFVVYDTNIHQNSLFGVYYYLVNFNDKPMYYVTAYTDTKVYHYEPISSIGAKLTLSGEPEEHFFGRVPITEYSNNDERLGDWEPDLDLIDSYDKAISEMANGEEDFSNATLVVNGDIDVPKTMKKPVKDSDGNIIYDENGEMVWEIDPNSPYLNTLSKVMYLKPSIINNANGGVTVVPSSAQYLTKELPIDNWKTHIDEIVRDIYTDTNTPNVNDENFGGNSSGVAMSYKLFGSDQVRETQNDLFGRGVKRRLRLVAHFWGLKDVIPNETLVNNVSLNFPPNLPKNDTETINNAMGLLRAGVSQETVFGYLASATGVKQEEEVQRKREQVENDPDRLDENMFNQNKNKSQDNSESDDEQ
ncbi:phage portal protein [Limosilactobacillus vaginalis]|uniref:phage portal protein n=1 Tax=Limosilactobacillus vaginalis TaxID=1633 RepID=UPI003735B48A